MTFRVVLGKDDFLFKNATFHFLLFEDKGRLHVHHNKIRIDHCRDNLYQASLSKIATDRDRTRFRYDWLGLFTCWIGHNYPVPSSPPHAPRSGAHWPNRMEYFTPSPLETNSYWLFDEQSVLQGYFIWDGSATFHFYPLHGICTKMVVTIWAHYNGLFLEQHKTYSNVFQLILNNTIYYTN